MGVGAVGVQGELSVVSFCKRLDTFAKHRLYYMNTRDSEVSWDVNLNFSELIPEQNTALQRWILGWNQQTL